MADFLASAVVYENPAGRLLAEPAGFLRIIWKAGTREFAHTQALFRAQQQAMAERGWSRILVDQRQMEPFSPAEQAWATAWLTEAVRVGYRYGAIIVSPNVMVRLATAFVTTQVQGMPLMYRSFEQEAEAVAWLLAQSR